MCWSFGRYQSILKLRQKLYCNFRTLCYDRIVDSGDWLLGAACCASPFDFQQAYGLDRDFALEISDHYPIEYQLNWMTFIVHKIVE